MFGNTYEGQEAEAEQDDRYRRRFLLLFFLWIGSSDMTRPCIFKSSALINSIESTSAQTLSNSLISIKHALGALMTERAAQPQGGSVLTIRGAVVAFDAGSLPPRPLPRDVFGANFDWRQRGWHFLPTR